MMLWPSYLYNGISATWEDHIYIETTPLSFPTGLLLTKRYTQYESHNWQYIIASWVQLWRLMSKQMDGQRSHGISQTNFKPRCLKGRKFWQSQAISNRIHVPDGDNCFTRYESCYIVISRVIMLLLSHRQTDDGQTAVTVKITFEPRWQRVNILLL